MARNTRDSSTPGSAIEKFVKDISSNALAQGTVLGAVGPLVAVADDATKIQFVDKIVHGILAWAATDETRFSVVRAALFGTTALGAATAKVVVATLLEKAGVDAKTTGMGWDLASDVVAEFGLQEMQKLTRDNVAKYLQDREARRANPSATTSTTAAIPATATTNTTNAPAAAQGATMATNTAAPTPAPQPAPHVDRTILMSMAGASPLALIRFAVIDNMLEAAMNPNRDSRSEVYQPRLKSIDVTEALKANPTGVAVFLENAAVTDEVAIASFFRACRPYRSNASIVTVEAATFADEADARINPHPHAAGWAIGTAEAILIVTAIVTLLVIGYGVMSGINFFQDTMIGLSGTPDQAALGTAVGEGVKVLLCALFLCGELAVAEFFSFPAIEISRAIVARVVETIHPTAAAHNTNTTNH